MTAENTDNTLELRFIIIGAIILAVAAAGVFIFMKLTENAPPRISGVTIAVRGEIIALNYSRYDPDGPEKKDSIKWTFDGVEKKEVFNKKEVPTPEGYDKTVEIYCVVTGFDGIDYSPRIKSNSIYHFRPAPKTEEPVAATEDEDLPLIQKIRKLKGSGIQMSLEPPPEYFAPAPAESTEEAAVAKATVEIGLPAAQTAEITLKGNFKDILTDRNVSGATVALGESASAQTSNWGDFELRAPAGTYKFTVTHPDYYTRNITSFNLAGNEPYNDFLIPKSFEIFYYDELARPRIRPYTEKWEKPPTIVIHNGPYGYVNYVATQADRTTIKDTIRSSIAPYLGWNIYSFNNNVTIIEDNYTVNKKKYDGPGYIIIFFEPRMDGAALGECGGAVNNNCQLVLKSKDKGVIIHEFLHALGFRSGHSSSKSIMTSEKSQNELTELDRQILKIHSRLRIGTTTPHNNITRDGR